MTSAQKKIQIFAAVSLGEGILAFLWLMSMPTNRQIYSVSRLAALLFILIMVGVSAAILIHVQVRDREVPAPVERVAQLRYRIPLSFLFMAAATVIWVAILYKSQWILWIKESTYLRLLPILIYIVLLLFQTGLFLLMLGQPKRDDTGELRAILRMTLVTWIVFLLLGLFVSLTHLGFIHDEVGLSWGPPGTPVSFAQVNLVFGISFLLFLGWQSVRLSQQRLLIFLFSKKDLILFLGLWLLAVLFWSTQPMSPTHFAPPPMSPNNEVYPNSDALIFDKSSYHLLNGTGFANQLIRRPLYVGLLALFHKFAGGNYDRTIFLQILVLAFIPPLVYLLTLELSKNRLAGLIAGGLILIREKNSIELSGLIVTSHAKLMMSDMLAMLGVILVTYLTVRWISRKNDSLWAPAIIGACLGLTALVRAQVLILVPLLLVFIFLSRKPIRSGLRAALPALLGLVLVMLPWVWRNWNLTGTFVLDDRGEERLLARNYSMTPFALPAPSQGETEGEFSARLKADILSFIRSHPAEVMVFVSNHFLRNMEVSSVYLTPAYSADTPSSQVQALPFWNDWTGTLTTGSGIALLLNLGILAFGICLAISKNKLAGSFPLLVFLLYSFGNALVRSSGWRFILPADWIVLVYYSIALAYLPSKITLFLPETAPVNNSDIPLWKTSISEAFLFILLLFLGASVPLAERVIPASQYDGLSKSAIADLSAQKYISTEEINNFLGQKDAVLLSGMALYPRYIRPNARIYLADAPGGDRFLDLWLINEADNQVILPLLDAPRNIPHTAIISVLGCRESKYISAYAIIVHQPLKQILLRDPGAPLQCPLAVRQ